MFGFCSVKPGLFLSDIVYVNVDVSDQVNPNVSASATALLNDISETYINSLLALDTMYPPVAGCGVVILRARRKVFQDWDDFLSYYRRMLHARIDILQSASLDPADLDMRHLSAVLADSDSVGSGRFCSSRLVMPKCVMSLCDHLDLFIPVASLADLVALEVEMSSLRAQTHRRLDAATVQLVSLYKNHPEVLRV